MPAPLEPNRPQPPGRPTRSASKPATASARKPHGPPRSTPPSLPPGTPFDLWAEGFAGLTDSGPALDFDNGGLATGIEWVLGGDPTNGSDDADLACRPSTPPAIRTARCSSFSAAATAARNDANTSIAVEYGDTLTGWTTAVHQGARREPDHHHRTADGYGPGIDKVTVALPANLAGGGKLFARLKVGVNFP